MSRRSRFKGNDDNQPCAPVTEVDADEARAREELDKLDRQLEAEEKKDDFSGFVSQPQTRRESRVNTPSAPTQENAGAFDFSNMDDEMFVESDRVDGDDADEQDVFAPISQEQSPQLPESPPAAGRMPASFFRMGRRNALTSEEEKPSLEVRKMRPAEKRIVEKDGHVVKKSRLNGEYEDSANKGRE